MSTSNTPRPAYHACLAEALQQAPLMMRRSCEALADVLYEKSISSPAVLEKRLLQEAVVALKSHQAAIERGFPAELTAQMKADTAPPGSLKTSNHSRSFASLRFEELELMGDEQVQQTLDGARLQQILVLASEAAFAGFSARLSTAQGFDSVKAEKNPLRPEVIACAALKLVDGIPIDRATRSRWLTYAAPILGQELQSFYGLLEKFLAVQQIEPAAYGVTTAPEDRIRQPAAAQKLPNDDRDPVLTLDHLHRLLLGDYDDSFSGDLSPGDVEGISASNQGFLPTVPAAIDLLVDLKEKGLVPAARERSRTPAPLPLAQLRAQLKREAKSLGQSLAIEVVGLMIEQIAHDPRLLPPVRQMVADAEPAFLRMGVTDPRFFSDKRHPARRLLEVITARSLAYASEDATGFAGFMADLDDMASLLTEEHASDAQHFAGLLQDFEGRQARRHRETSAEQARAVQALLQAEQRNLLAEKIATEIRARPDFFRGSAIVTSFLTGPWAQVMARERLMGAHGPGAHRAVFSLALGDVLWSLNARETSRHRKRLLKIIPGMLASLREGLVSIGYPLEQSKPFYDELMLLHQGALKAPPETEAPQLKTRDDLEKFFKAGDEAGVTQPWIAPEEARQSGFMGMDEQESPAEADAHVARSTPPVVLESGGRRAAMPTMGAWVEMLVGVKWLRAQLTWISPHGTLFMFTSAGPRSHSFTSALLQQLLISGRVRVVSQQGVLDGALDNVARVAMRNSVDSSLEF